MKFLNPAKRKEYVLEADRSSQTPTVFVFKRLTREDFFEFSGLSPFTLEQAAKIDRILKPSRDEKRVPTDEERAEVQAVMPDFKETAKALTRAYDFALQRGLVEIRNLYDESMQPLQMSVPDFISYAPVDVVQELGSALIEWSVLGEADRKNSVAQSAPGSQASTAQSAPESPSSPPAA